MPRDFFGVYAFLSPCLRCFRSVQLTSLLCESSTYLGFAKMINLKENSILSMFCII